jgi:hypothetical protein
MAFPVVETIKKERKLHETIAPARIDDEVSGELQRIVPTKPTALAITLAIRCNSPLTSSSIRAGAIVSCYRNRRDLCK